MSGKIPHHKIQIQGKLRHFPTRQYPTKYDKNESSKRKFSNRPFEGDKRTTEQARAYQDWQTVNRHAIEEQRRWNELQTKLGKDNPYADIGALRRAMRSDENSFAYKKSHYAVSDFKQYRQWKSILGEENMPKSLADFQDLKYNNSDQYERLKGFKEYRIDNPKATQVDYQKAVSLKEKGIKGEIHIPPLVLDNVEDLEFDDYHANVESGHNVTKEDAVTFIKEAKVSMTVWNGTFERYYSEDGATYVNLELNAIRTSFKVAQFEGDAEIILEEMQKWKDE